MDPNQQQNNQQKQQQKGGNQQNKDGLTVSSNFSYSDSFNVKEVLASSAVNAGAYMAGTVFAAAIGPMISRGIKGMWGFFSGNKGQQTQVNPPQMNIREQIGRLCNTDPQQAESIMRQIQGSLKKQQPAIEDTTPAEPTPKAPTIILPDGNEK